MSLKSIFQHRTSELQKLLQSIDLNPSNQTITKGVNDKLFFGEGFRFGSEDVESVQFSIGGQDVLVPRFLNPVVEVTADTVHCQFPIKLWNSYLLASNPSWVSLPSNMTLETPTSFKPPMPIRCSQLRSYSDPISTKFDWIVSTVNSEVFDFTVMTRQILLEFECPSYLRI